MKKLLIIALLSTSVAFASETEDIKELKKQLELQKELIQQLQQRLQQLEEKQEKSAKIEKEAERKISEIDKLSNPFSQAKFVPDISFIADFSYVNRNIRDETYKALEIPAFVHSHPEDNEGLTDLNKDRGFNLNYGELYIASPVDPYFDLVGVFHLSEDSFEIEETYINTKTLPFGLKIGKFYSSFGRLNQQHPHQWDFADQPLVYNAIFGADNLLEKGVQLNWVAPTPFYLQIGTELLQGENELSFGTKGFIVNTKKDGNGDNINIPDTQKPNLYTLFAKTSFDITDNLTTLFGLSYAEGKTRIDHLEDTDNPHAFAGKTKIYGADLTFRYNIDSYRYISWQSEYIYRNMDGTRYGYNGAGNLVMPRLEKKQAGLYSQIVYRFNQRWRAGFRYDLLNKNDVYINGINQNQPDNLYKYAFMIDYSPTEFSRIRLQFNQDRSKFVDNNRKTINEVILQFNMAIGAHGAHPF